MTDKQFEQIECLSKKLWEDINNGYEYSMVTYSEFLGIVTEVWESLQEEPNKVKFNVGDTIKNKDGYEVTIESIGDDCYFVDKAQACIKFSTQDQWELVEEPVSNDLEEAADKFVKSYTKGGTKQSWLKEGYIAGAQWQKTKDESTTEDLEEYINELSKQFPEVSFAKLSRIAVRVAKWQKEQMMTKAIDGEILEMEDNDYAMCSHTHLELCIEPDTLEKNGFKDKDRVKVIVIKED